MAVRKLLAPFDIGLARLSKMDAVSTTSRRARFMEQEDISVVLDVGAHVGNYGRSLRKAGYTGRIESFEPRPAAYAQLRECSWGTHQVALGPSDGTMDFNVSQNQVSSSALQILPTHLEGAPGSVIESVIVVEVRALDSMALVRQTDRAMLKLDVQGYEKRVLEGATETLLQTRLIEMELSVAPLYEGQMLYREAIDKLTDLGFELIWISRGFQHAQTGRLLQMDAIFGRS